MTRVFLLGPFANDEINQKMGASGQTGAIRNKMLGLSHAFEKAGYSTSIVSAVPGAAKNISHQSFRDKNILIDAFLIPKSKISRLFSLFSYVRRLAQAVTDKDIVVFYNFFPEYALTAAYLKVRGCRFFIDVEDGPRTDELSPREVIGWLCFQYYRFLRPSGYLIVSRELSTRLNLPRSLVVHGVADLTSTKLVRRIPQQGRTFTVLYGGTLNHDTGLELFLEMLPILQSRSSEPFRFVLTGYFDHASVQKKLDALSLLKNIVVEIKPSLSINGYQQLLFDADAALSLKLPDSQVGQTTFPSKLVEYAANKIPIIATRCANVEEILEPGSCFYVEEAKAGELADQILRVQCSDHRSSKIADEAYDCVNRHCGVDNVAARLNHFFAQ